MLGPLPAIGQGCPSLITRLYQETVDTRCRVDINPRLSVFNRFSKMSSGRTILPHRENTSWALRFGAREGAMRTFVRAFWFSLLMVTSLYASTNGSISGLVTDSSGAVVASATITAINTQTGIKSTTRTDDKGFYSFPLCLLELMTSRSRKPASRVSARPV